MKGEARRRKTHLDLSPKSCAYSQTGILLLIVDKLCVFVGVQVAVAVVAEQADEAHREQRTRTSAVPETAIVFLQETLAGCQNKRGEHLPKRSGSGVSSASLKCDSES